MNLRVIKALILKYILIWSRTSFRIMDIFFWPVIDLLVWGFVTVYMLKVGNVVPSLITFLIAAIIFWNILYRSQQVVCVSFLDDVWSRNLLNIFASPIRTSEYVTATYIVGLIQSVIVMCLLGVLAYFLYSFNFLILGIGAALLFVNLLLMGWALGLFTTGFILRWGPPAEGLAWALPFLVQPISAVFYPVSVLPAWLQPVAWCVPSTYVFEGLRQYLAQGHLDITYVQMAFLLNVAYMVVCGLVFHFFFEEARKLGYLAKFGS
ncbi:MAG: ABC transporter [Candidatus Melainabacteria bacterium]|nr:MAG: ABC transporter [Candidatus Melainabacteria bacterium]